MEEGGGHPNDTRRRERERACPAALSRSRPHDSDSGNSLSEAEYPLDMDAYTREEKAEMRRSLARGEAPFCPRCSGIMEESVVRPHPDVAYMRKRVWLGCRECGRSVVVDRPRQG